MGDVVALILPMKNILRGAAMQIATQKVGSGVPDMDAHLKRRRSHQMIAIRSFKQTDSAATAANRRKERKGKTMNLNAKADKLINIT